MQQQTGREEERMVKVDYTNLLPYGNKQAKPWSSITNSIPNYFHQPHLSKVLESRYEMSRQKLMPVMQR